MAEELRCPNPACGHPSRLGGDPLGRAFRCTRCTTLLPRGTGGPRRERGLSLGLVARVSADTEAPWEREETSIRSRTLGVALPSRVGRYRIQSQVEAIGSTTTYRALDSENGTSAMTPLDLKVVHAAGQSGPRERSAFIERSRGLVSLRHPGIVPILDGGHEGALPYLVTTPVEGENLAKWLSVAPKLDLVDAVGLVIEVAEALGYAHRNQVVHGALEPDSIILTRDGRPLLSEFAPSTPEPSRPGRDQSVRSPVYVAPELLVESPSGCSPESDQYALGAILFLLICGRPPFDGPPSRIIDEAIHDGPIPPRDWNPRVPRELERICLTAMARDPSDRFPNCEAMADYLRRWASRAGTATRAVRTIQRAADWARKRPAAAASAALTLAGVIATTVLASALIASTAMPTATALGRPLDGEDPPQLARGRD
ncbi:MAG: serine/threonine-protein kinase [Isosphaeraceae bacterium]